MKSPAFQVYVNDFLGSAKVGMMSTEEIGAYWLLLFLEWQEVGFVYNEPQLARWCRLTPARFRKAWVALSPCFVELDGRLYNPRLQKEREKQEAWRLKSSEAGIKGAEKRWGKRVTKPSPNDNQPHSSLLTNGSPKDDIPLPLPLQVTTRSKEKTSSAPSGATNGDHSWPAEGTRIWVDRVGHITTAHFGKALKPMVDKYGWPDTRAALETYIEMQEDKIRKVEYLAAEHVRWVALAKMPCVDPDSRELTEKGRMAYNS